MQIVKDEQVEKPRSEWNETERRKAQHDLVAKNIITSALTMDEFFRISQCKSAKEMWEVLEVTHEGTENDEESSSESVSNFSADSDNYDDLFAAFKETHDEANRLAVICNKLQKNNKNSLEFEWDVVVTTPLLLKGQILA
ncbi:uncharacterized protein [Phaseolus vulgaris]|uniref:uncharacterized protein n=1 Tax=Phaseolus vulgaris TaxID=3885 RepID=UPI0035CC8151